MCDRSTTPRGFFRGCDTWICLSFREFRRKSKYGASSVLARYWGPVAVLDSDKKVSKIQAEFMRLLKLCKAGNQTVTTHYTNQLKYTKIQKIVKKHKITNLK